MQPVEAVARHFNEAINNRDLNALTALMTDDHRFIDPAGTVVAGRSACTEVWRSFSATFPDYRNRFDTVTVDADEVVIDGSSDCSTPELAGPARWHVRVRDGLVTQWQVDEAI